LIGDEFMITVLYDYCKFIDIDNQIEKISEELNEVFYELEQIKVNNKIKSNNLGLECFDLIQAVFTLLKNVFSDDEIKELNRMLLMKLQKRNEEAKNDTK
jgi:hypothetical protein